MGKKDKTISSFRYDSTEKWLIKKNCYFYQVVLKAVLNMTNDLYNSHQWNWKESYLQKV